MSNKRPIATDSISLDVTELLGFGPLSKGTANRPGSGPEDSGKLCQVSAEETDPTQLGRLHNKIGTGECC